MTTLWIPEASILTGKSEVTIRRVVKAGKVSAKMTNQWYAIDKDSLFALFREVKHNENIMTTHENNIEDNQNTLNEVIKPLLERIAYYDNERERTMFLLESWKTEKEQIVKELTNEKDKIEKEMGSIIQRKDRIMNIQKWIILWLVIIFIISILVLKGILQIRI